MGRLGFKDQITFIYCDNLQRTTEFYEGVLGFELVVDQGSCRIVWAPGTAGGYLGYCAREGGGKDRSGIIITLVTTRVDDWYQFLVGRGVELEGPPRLNDSFGIYHFFFKDPDGYRLEIQRFEDRGWKNNHSSE